MPSSPTPLPPTPSSALRTADTAQAEGARSDTAQTAAPKRRRRPLLLAGAGVLAVAAVWGGLALATTQHLFGDASVAGTKVGGMSPAAARSAVTEAVDAELAEPVTITVGTGLDVDASVKDLTADWPLGADSVALVAGEAQPGIIDTTLTPLLSGDLTVTAAGSDAEEAADGRTLTLTPEQTAALTTITADGGDLTAVLPATVSEPEVTTPEKDWTMEEVVGEYSTPYTSQYGRDQNLIAGTGAINATLVRAGETFSLSDALGPVDAEHGFAAAGVISAGQHTDAMGGGLSEVNTTVFNAGFEAGMDDVEHHPHTYWFTRYPAGRDAALWTGVLDLKFKNSTPGAVLLQAWVSGGEVHARLWGARYYDVSIDNGTPHNYRAYATKVESGSSCTPYAGGERGFDITVTRHRTKPDGTSLPDDVLTTSYQSDDPVVCR